MVNIPSAKQTCAIITTYQPEHCLVECVKSIMSQVAEIIIVDDGNSKGNVAKLGRWFGNISQVTLWHQKTNSGIAAALNVGVNIAREKGYKWFLTLDDDSIPDSDMVQRLCEHLAKIKDPQTVGIIGMMRSDNNRRTTLPERNHHLHLYLDKRGIITSGSLFSLQTYTAVGPFREEFFIDSVDYDYCMRARAKGLRVIQVQEHGFTHSLGQEERFQMGGYVVETASHSPIRLYYDFRNSTILAMEYFPKDPLFACATAVSQFKTILRCGLFQKNKKAKLSAMMKGYMDAIRGRMGKIEI